MWMTLGTEKQICNLSLSLHSPFFSAFFIFFLFIGDYYVLEPERNVLF